MPLVLLALALGGALVAYQFSPKTHEWVDEHVAALRAALAAHREAAVHVDQAHGALAAHQATRQAAASLSNVATLPALVAQGGAALSHAWDSVLRAADANARAADATAAAAQTAKTPAQRAAVAQSANVVEAHGQAIDAALAKLGAGKCGVRAYGGMTAARKDALLGKLHDRGMTVTGDNPWDVDTGIFGVQLRGLWDSTGQKLYLVVVAPTDPTLYPGLCGMIWKRIDPVLGAIGAEAAHGG